MDYFNRFVSWYQAGGDGPYWLWLSSGFFLLALFFMGSHRLFRSMLGHRKFRGTWYNGHQYQELLMMTYIDREKGNRVMRHDENQLLSEWEFGKTKGFSQAKGLDFRP